MVEIGFACKYCEEVLAIRADSKGIVKSDELHSCFGERPGFVASVDPHDIVLGEGIKMVSLN